MCHMQIFQHSPMVEAEGQCSGLGQRAMERKGWIREFESEKGRREGGKEREREDSQ